MNMANSPTKRPSIMAPRSSTSHTTRADSPRAKRLHTIHLLGVLPDIERDARIVRDTAPAGFVEKVEELQKKSNDSTDKRIRETVQLKSLPPGFDWKFAGLKSSAVAFDAANKTLTAKERLAGKDVKAILVAGGNRELRDTLSQLMVNSARFRVSSWWLFWAYIIATLGELCLSPVGLSMVSKLAPAEIAPPCSWACGW